MPQELRGLVGHATFKPDVTNYVEVTRKGVRQTYLDCAFAARVKVGKHWRSVVAAFEHKSTADAGTRRQLQRSAQEITEHYAKAHEKSMPPIVMLLVAYHGGRPWKKPLVTVGPELDDAASSAYTLQLPYRLVDLARPQPEELPEEDPVLLAMLRTQGLIRRVERNFRRMRPEFEEIFRGLKPFSWEEELTVEYMMSQVAEEDQPVIGKMLEQVLWTIGPKGREESVRNVIQAAGERGMAKIIEMQLSERFGPLSEEDRARIAQGTSKDLGVWGKRVLVAERVDDVFKNGATNGSGR